MVGYSDFWADSAGRAAYVCMCVCVYVGRQVFIMLVASILLSQRLVFKYALFPKKKFLYSWGSLYPVYIYPG